MRITEIAVHRVLLPLVEGGYAWSGGNRVTVFDSTIVAVRTDAGLTGWGESCPLGAAYLPAHALGVRAGLAVLAPALLGADPTATGALGRRMDEALKGHPHAKSALDMAAWDLLGQAAGLPVCRLLGGPYDADVALYRAISQAAPEAMAASVERHRAAGYTKFQLKVGAGVDVDVARIRACAAVLAPGELLIADANTGWTMAEAARVCDRVADLDVVIEQPCPTWAGCLAVRRRTAKAFVLDELIDGMEALVRGVADGAMDAVNLKIAKLGGLTRARELRDACVRLGVAVTIEDTWGGDIVTAAIAHLAHSTPPELLLSTTDFNSYVTVSTAEGAPARRDGRMAASTAPGLGVTPRPEVLGPPLERYG